MSLYCTLHVQQSYLFQARNLCKVVQLMSELTRSPTQGKPHLGANMNVNQAFNSANFKHHMTSMNPILALLMVFAMTLVAMTLLPFLLLFGLISFFTLRFFGKKMLRRQQAEQARAYQHYANVQREPAAPYADMFKHSGTSQGSRTGRTFEHRAD